MTYRRLTCSECDEFVGVYPAEKYPRAPTVYCSPECWAKANQTTSGA